MHSSLERNVKIISISIEILSLLFSCGLTCHTISCFYPSFKRTVHPGDFENKCLLQNACPLIRYFKTDKVQTKAETIERTMKWQGSSSKRLFFIIAGVYSSLERSVQIISISIEILSLLFSCGLTC